MTDRRTAPAFFPWFEYQTDTAYLEKDSYTFGEIAENYIHAYPVAEASAFRLELTAERPDLSQPIANPVGPCRLFGFYNGANDTMELYYTNKFGDGWMPLWTHPSLEAGINPVGNPSED